MKHMRGKQTSESLFSLIVSLFAMVYYQQGNYVYAII